MIAISQLLKAKRKSLKFYEVLGFRAGLGMRSFLCLLVKRTVSLGNKLFLNSTHLLDINVCAYNNCNKVFILKKSKIHIMRHLPRIDMGWRPLTRVCLLHSFHYRRRYIVSINIASIKAQHCLSISGIQIILFLDRYNQMQSQFSVNIIIFHALFSEINLQQGDTVPLM